MIAAALRTLLVVATRAVAVLFGLAISVYLQLGGDIRAPVAVQIDDVIAKLREIARVLNSFG